MLAISGMRTILFWAGVAMENFRRQYGPWAIVAGASDGVGAAFVEALAQSGINVVLVARRETMIQALAEAVASRHGVEARALALDLAADDAAQQLWHAVGDLEIGSLIYCAGAQADHLHFLDAPVAQAEAMLHRNCTVPMQLCHLLMPAMVSRGRGGVIIIGSGAGFAGAPNMVAYGATKAFDMVFAEALWTEVKPLGVDVLGLILGETDTPALRKLKVERGQHSSVDDPVPGTDTPQAVVEQAFAYWSRGPTRMANRQLRWGSRLFSLLSRNMGVKLMTRASESTTGK